MTCHACSLPPKWLRLIGNYRMALGHLESSRSTSEVVFSCQGCCNKVPQRVGLKQQKCRISQSEIKVLVELASPEGHEGEICTTSLPPASGGLLAIFNDTWHMVTSPCALSSSPHGILLTRVRLCPNFPFLMRTPVILDQVQP